MGSQRMRIGFCSATLLVVLIFSSGRLFAACHVVTPTGSGNQSGSDWNNAYASLPATLTRGDTYYLADGTYPSMTINSVPGTAVIEIRKAQTYDHCTDTGWNAGTMGSGQAFFQSTFYFDLSYFVVNGNGQQTAPGCGNALAATVIDNPPPNPKDCGIKFDDSASGTYPAIKENATNLSHITFKYVELKGDPVVTHYETSLVMPSVNCEGPYNTWQHIYGHSAGAVYFQYAFGPNTLLSDSYFWGIQENGYDANSPHGQFSFEAGGSNNVTVARNVFRDMSGTAVFTFASGPGTNDGWVIYDNVFVATSNTAPIFGHLANGVVACINSDNCTNFLFYNNSIVNIGGPAFIQNENTGSYTARNNLWYRAAPTVLDYGGTTLTQDHNSAIATGGTCLSGATNICDASGPNPFVNYPGNNFNLVNGSNADWINRVSLGSPYDTDAAGNGFTTNRGPFQVVTSTGVNPPSGLVATVQ